MIRNGTEIGRMGSPADVVPQSSESICRLLLISPFQIPSADELISSRAPTRSCARAMGQVSALRASPRREQLSSLQHYSGELRRYGQRYRVRRVDRAVLAGLDSGPRPAECGRDAARRCSLTGRRALSRRQAWIEDRDWRCIVRQCQRCRDFLS